MSLTEVEKWAQLKRLGDKANRAPVFSWGGRILIENESGQVTLSVDEMPAVCIRDFPWPAKRPGKEWLIDRLSDLLKQWEYTPSGHRALAKTKVGRQAIEEQKELG